MKIIGHRGARNLAPENTLRSFEKAIEHHVDEIELDVRVTRDGYAVLVHHPYITDPAGNELQVADHAFAELLQHKPDLTTLGDAIAAIDRRVPIYIEVKPRVPTVQTVSAIRGYLERGWTADDFRLGSFDQAVLRELHAALPDIQKIVIENWSSLRAIRRARRVGTRRISMLENWLWPGFIRSMRRRGYELYSFPPKDHWKERILSYVRLTGTTNDPKRARRWASHGLAGVITDRPDLFDK
jgi:glycerophosphoryl diester phosphodiesterase